MRDSLYPRSGPAGAALSDGATAPLSDKAGGTGLPARIVPPLERKKGGCE